MTDTEMNIAIAESLGWKRHPNADWKRHHIVVMFNPEGNRQGVPSYTTDLNAMHEVIMSNTEAEFSTGTLDQILWESYKVKHLISPFDRLQATASQLAEAFLKTNNLYTS